MARANQSPNVRPVLTRWLKENGKNQSWLAEQTGVRQSTVSAWLGGAGIMLDHAIRVQAATGLSMVEINLVTARESISSHELPTDDEDDALPHNGTEG